MPKETDLGIATKTPVRVRCDYSFKCHKDPSLAPPIHNIAGHPTCAFVTLNYKTIHEERIAAPRVEYSFEIELDHLIIGENKLTIAFAAEECQVDLNKKALFGFGSYTLESDGFRTSGSIIPKWASGWEFHDAAFKFEWRPA